MGVGCGRGYPPSHGRELFHFPTWKCAIWGIFKKEISTLKTIGEFKLWGRKGTDGGRVWEGGHWEGGVPPPTVGSFLIFWLENVQSWAYLRRKFRLKNTIGEFKLWGREGTDGGRVGRRYPPSHGRELFPFFDLKMFHLGHTWKKEI